MDGRCLLAVLAVVLIQLGDGVMGNLVFEVENKFKASGRQRTLGTMKEHDNLRHGRMLASIDIPLGGNGHPQETGLYFAKIGLGTPSDEYYVQVDTGSDLLWVNCAGCSKCPTKSDLGIKLKLFDPTKSNTSGEVKCSDAFCATMFDKHYPGSCAASERCLYSVSYGDGSSTNGYFVKDYVQLDQVTGNLKTRPLNATVVFGCGAKQSGDLGSSSEAAVDGILGFGQANSSMLSQLAAAGKVKKEFAHCLDVIKGGGIFAVGDVVSPKVKTTPMVANMPHYNVILESIEVDGNLLELPTSLFDAGDQRGTVIDSGTTLVYLPQTIYDSIMNKILARQPGLKLLTVDEQFACFQFTQNIDDAFPAVTFHFRGSVPLNVSPHEYLFAIRDNFWCIGWQNGGLQSRDGRQMILLGGAHGGEPCMHVWSSSEPIRCLKGWSIDVYFTSARFLDQIYNIKDWVPSPNLVLSNKLVIYDVENQTIGWTEYNCSSSIKVHDEASGADYSTGSHNISSGLNLTVGKIFMSLSLLLALLQSFNVF